MQITLSDIQTFSECPRFYGFLKDVKNKPLPQDISIATNVIKKAYIIATETGFKANWRRVLGWVNTAVMSDVDVMDQEQYAVAKQLAEHILKFIQRWYYDIYLEEHVTTYIDISINIPIISHMVQTVIPIIKVDDVPGILVVTNNEVTHNQLMNNIVVCGQMAMLAKELDANIISYEALQMGPYGGFNSTIIVRNQQQHDKCMKMLYYLSQSINVGVDYPSVTQKCDVCAFRRRCKI